MRLSLSVAHTAPCAQCGESLVSWSAWLTRRGMATGAGVRNLWDPEPEPAATDADRRYGEVVRDTRGGGGSVGGGGSRDRQRMLLTAPDGNSSSRCTVTEVKEAEHAKVAVRAVADAEGEKEAVAAGDDDSAGAVLRRSFPHGHPALERMEAWLHEEGLGTAASLAPLQGVGAAADCLRAQLMEIGLKCVRRLCPLYTTRTLRVRPQSTHAAERI